MLNTLKTQQTTKDQFIKEIIAIYAVFMYVVALLWFVLIFSNNILLSVKILLVNHTSPVVNLNSLPYILWWTFQHIISPKASLAK